MSQRLVERASQAIANRTSRRGFLIRSALVGSALAVAPGDFIFKPLTAYQAVCGCANLDCDCGAACCNGWTQFCCSINGGLNVCPQGTFLGGWWKADGSTYCAGPRYYMDCNAYCSCNTATYESFCDTACDGLTCECAGGTCDNMHIGCSQFRYGQCHQEVAISGRILCRVVTCTPPWELDASCTTATAIDDATAEQNAPCLQNPPPPAPPAFPAMAAFPSASTTPNRGYWLTKSNGDVYSFGDAGYHGSPAQLNPSITPGGTNSSTMAAPVVAMAPTPTGSGYWLATANGDVYSFGDAGYHGSPAQLNPSITPGGTNSSTMAAPVVAMAPTPTGSGYWLATANGDVYSFGDAGYHGSPAQLNPSITPGGTNSSTMAAPVVAMAPTPTGSGYWLATANGDVYSFGDAGYHGSPAQLNPSITPGGTNSSTMAAPVVAMAPTPTGSGYWLATANGDVYSFGDAGYHGSPAQLNPSITPGGTNSSTMAAPVVAMAPTPTGSGYWLATANGDVYSFGDAPYQGSAP